VLCGEEFGLFGVRSWRRVFGASGLLVRSAAVPLGINVAVFPCAHPDDRMKVVEGEKLARLGIRLRV
jgi:hypothetical protein